MEPGNKQRQYATAVDWARHRGAITRLYHNERKTLKELMAVMQSEYGFAATPRMYKRKIEEWNLNKKLKEDDVLQVLRILSSIHNAPNSASPPPQPVSFRIRGQLIANERLHRYVGSNPRVVDRLYAGDPPSARSVAVVEPVYTLPSSSSSSSSAAASPPQQTEFVFVQEQPPNSSRSSSPLVRAYRRRTPSPPRWLMAAGQTSAPSELEQMLRSMRIYVGGCLEGGAWAHDATGCWSAGSTAAADLRLLDEWHAPYFAVYNAVQARGPMGADPAAIEEFFGIMPGVVRARPPFLLVSSMVMMMRLLIWQTDLAGMFARYVAELVAIYFGPEHELCRIFRHLIYFIGEGFPASYLTAMKFLMETFEEYLGPQNGLTVFASIPYVAVHATHLGVDKNFIKLFVKYLKQLSLGNPLMPPTPPPTPSSSSSPSPSPPSAPLVLRPRRESEPPTLSESGSAAVYNKPIKSLLFGDQIAPESRRIILALSGDSPGSGEDDTGTAASPEPPAPPPGSSVTSASPARSASRFSSSITAMTDDSHVSSPPGHPPRRQRQEGGEEPIDGLQIARRQFKYTMAHGNMSPHTFNSFTKHFATILPGVFQPGGDGGNVEITETKSPKMDEG